MPSTRRLFRRSPENLLVLMALQLWCVGAVCAEWLLVDRNEKDAIYVDSESISRNGEIVRALVLDDLKAASTRGLSTFLSTRNQEEHDCSKERFRLVAIERFAGNMGTGHSIYKKSGESSWVPISRGTLAQSVWKVLCGKK